MIASLSIIKKILKTKIKFYDDEAADFYDQKIPQTDSNYSCLAVICLYSVLRKDEYYYPQVFLKECKSIEKNVIKSLLH